MSDKIEKYSIKSRREGRVLAFQSLFSYGFDYKDLESLLKFDWIEEDYSKESLEYAKLLVKGTLNNIDEIDKVIKSKLKNWDYERISNIDKAILRFATFSLLFEQGIPEKVVINEAVEIVKKFGTEESYKFINGILDAIKRNKEKNG